ncbi:copper resistance CopC/CopD family protein [Nocardioides sp.]|uniref:copper resistance CopC/CopD family protein n=1 Tax=Nocardioides sp. TaxID=35761 RepID=UPI003D129772
MTGGLLGRLGAALGACAAVVLLASGPASAHSETVRSDPPNGGMVAEGRTSLTLWFDEGIGAAASTFQLRTLDGLEVPSSAVFENGDVKIVIDTEPLARGQYVLDWHALSLEDGHASSGSVVFGAGLRPDTVASDGVGAPSPTLVGMRWVDLTALLMAVGALAVGGRVLAAGGGPVRVTQRVRLVGTLAAWVAVYAGLAEPFLRLRGSTTAPSAWLGQTWLTLTGTDVGRLWILREVALVVAGVAMLRWYRTHGRSAPAPRIALGALVVAALLASGAGHASSLPVGSGLDMVMGAGHVLAAGVWVGGLAVLAVTVLPLRGSARSADLSRLAMWRAFSPRAAVSCVVLIATGLFQAGHHLPDLSSVPTTVYGAAVAGKVLLVAVALALAGINTLLVNPAAADRVAAVLGLRLRPTTPRGLARTVTAEAMVLILAVALAAVLTSVPTAREIAVATRPAAPQAANVDGLFLTFEAVSDGPRRNRLILRMRSTIQPEPAPVLGVDVDLTGPGGEERTVALPAVEPGRYEASTAALEPGAWTATVRTHRSGLPDSVMTAAWAVPEPAAALAHPLGRVTSILATLLLLALGLVVGFRRRRSRPPHSDGPGGMGPGAAAESPLVLVRSSR